MDLLTYLPILVGVSLFCITLFFRSRGKKQEKIELLSATSAKSTRSVKDLKQLDKCDSPAIVQPVYGPIHILFGSQTGAAHNYSNILAEEATKAGFEPKVVDLVDFHPQFFKDVKLALFAMSTHGEGEAPENAKIFSEYISEPERTGDEFKGVKFSVFALGNKQYQFFCGQGRKVNQYMEKLGGERVYKLGEGDDNENLEDDFNAWKEGIWTELKKVCQPLSVDASATSKTVSQDKNALPFVATIRSDLQEIDLDTYNAANDGKEYDFQVKQYLSSASANLTSLRELRQKVDDGSTLHVEIDCASAGLTYKTAQNLAIYPENNPELVDKMAKLLNLNLDDVFTIEQNPESNGKFKHPIPSPISVKTYLTKFCDLQSAMRKKQLKDMAPLCQNEDNKKKLLFISSVEGKTEFEVQVQSRMKGLVDIVEDFGVQLSLEDLIQISSPIMPRLYTIASSDKKYSDTVHLCVSISVNDLPDGKKKVGLNSDFLVRQYKQHLQGQSLGKARINIKDSTFILPVTTNTPIIMVGPGAGIAPFKGMVDEKAHLARAGGDNPYGEMTLYFGCKGENWDNLYREEFTQHHADGQLNDYYVAFSRQQEQKVYVQDLMWKNKEQMMKLLFETNAILYICGSMSMGKSLMAKLGEIAASYYMMDAQEAQSKIEELEKNKRIIKELWG